MGQGFILASLVALRHTSVRTVSTIWVFVRPETVRSRLVHNPPASVAADYPSVLVGCGPRERVAKKQVQYQLISHLGSITPGHLVDVRGKFQSARG